VPTVPHGDTLNVTFSRLDPDQGQAVVTNLARTLIRKKVLDQYRLLGRYFVVAIDGTGRLTFSERHCSHCLTMTHHGRTIYYHPVLEAKLVCPNGLVISLMTGPSVENPSETRIPQFSNRVDLWYNRGTNFSDEVSRWSSNLRALSLRPARLVRWYSPPPCSNG